MLVSARSCLVVAECPVM